MTIRSNKFKMNDFIKISDRAERLRYAKEHLTLIGEGSSRHVFVFSSRFALKIAISVRGMEQNKVEVKSFIASRNSPVIAQIFQMDENYEWLLTELVRPFQTQSEFKKLFGMETYQLDSILGRIGLSNTGGKANINEDEFVKLDPHIQDVVRFAADSRVCHEDFSSVRQWGQTVDGRAVLLDYGLNYYVWYNYY